MARQPAVNSARRLVFSSFLTLLLLASLCSVSFAEAAPAEDKPLWNLAWITDTECYWMGHSEYMAPLLEKVRANKPKMVIHTGDTSFEWANHGSWREIIDLLRIETPPIEFHLAPGNHDDEQTTPVKPWLGRAATQGIYPLDTGEIVPEQGYYKDHRTQEVAGPEWPIWNPEVAANPHWQPNGGFPGHYVFKRGGIRFIVLDFYSRPEWQEWLEKIICQPDDSSVSIILQHKTREHYPGDDLKCLHNVKLVLSGHLQGYKRADNRSVSFIRGAGIANGPDGENDAFTLWVYKDHLRLDRYFVPPGGRTMPPVEGPVTVWTCKGNFSEYVRPEFPTRPPEVATPDETAPAKPAQ